MKPRANAAFSVSVKMPFADEELLARDDASGSSPPRPGAKNTVTVEMEMFSR